MKARVSALSAIGIEYLIRIARPYLFMGGFIFIVLLAADVACAYFINEWWLILALPILLFGFLFGAAWLALEAALKRIRPNLNDAQKVGVSRFVNKLDSVSAGMHTSKFIIFFRLIRDVLTRKRVGYIHEMTQNTASLKSDYEKLNELF